MLSLAKEKGFHFDAVLFPSNVMDWSFRSFVHQVMPVALSEGIAVQTMKPMGGKFILEADHSLDGKGERGCHDRHIRALQNQCVFRLHGQNPSWLG